MVKRIKLGLIFIYTEDHIAISYYILNIIRGLNHLSDELKPEITIFCRNDEDFTRVQKTSYPFLIKKRLQTSPTIVRGINKATKLLFKKSMIGFKYPKDTIDVIFPASAESMFRDIPHKLYWAGDFQDLYYPEFFSKMMIRQRKLFRERIAYNNSHLVFSSHDSQNQFQDHFPKNNVIKHVYQFTVTHPEYQSLDFNQLKEKYNITQPYFITPNQFWIHKNHNLIIDAVIELKKRRSDFQIIFTGRERDGRDMNYADDLKKRVADAGLNDQIKFLGFIDRRDLLKLIDCSIAVVQPSFFEGWNTTVEDAKAMNQLVIASDLSVHQEQLGDHGIYFNPKDVDALIKLLEVQLNNSVKQEFDFKYQDRIVNSGKIFLNILQTIYTS